MELVSGGGREGVTRKKYIMSETTKNRPGRRLGWGLEVGVGSGGVCYVVHANTNGDSYGLTKTTCQYSNQPLY